MSTGNSNIIISLEVYQGDDLVKTAEYTESGITIGSGESAICTLSDPSLAELLSLSLMYRMTGPSSWRT